MRAVDGLEKKPSTGELLAWTRVIHRAGIQPADLEGEVAETPFLGALVKSREDLETIQGTRR